MTQSIQNRIIKHGLEPINSILFHPDNWKIHPARQQQGVNGSLKKIGWVEPVLINLRTGEAWGKDRGVAVLLDGHMRVTLAARAREPAVPAIYVDLDPEEEIFVLSTLDPLGALAVTDNTKLLALMKDLDKQNEAIKAALRGAGIDTRETFKHIAQAGELEKTGGERPRSGGGEGKPLLYMGEGTPKRSTPESRQKYPLAIVLDRPYYDLWNNYKSKIGLVSDTDALKALLDKVIEEE